MKKRISPSIAAIILAIAFITSTTPLRVVDAAISSCSASVSPTSLNTNQGAPLTFSITNNDGNPATWVKITRPSSDFTINGGSSSGWSRSVDTDNVTFTGGSLSGGAHNFSVTVQTGIASTSPQAWNIQISDSSDGSSPTTCSGSTSVAITGDSTAPVISNIQATAITASSATITWTTNESANSVVNYGQTASYGSNASSSSLTTSHSVNLTGLTAGTVYHFRVQSTDNASNTATSSDQTFTTSTEGNNSLTISNVSVTGIGTGSATVTWQTNNVADSRVDFGTTSAYGQSQSDGADVTSHSITLSGLSAGTVYHYKITSQDQIGNTKSTSDNTFTTAAQSGGGGSSDSGSSGGTSGGSSGSGSSTTTPTPSTSTAPSSGSGSSSGGDSGNDSSGGGGSEPTQPAQDTTSPAIQASTSFTQSYSTAPQITGIATDNVAVQSISYSIDGGLNWLPVLSVQGINTTRTTFSFTPNVTEDDNYSVQLRARDTSGNFGFSPTYTLVIDQLPPIIGAGLYAVGAAAADITAAIVGFDQQVTLSAVGGPIQVDIVATSISGGDTQVFSLTKNPETGLWSGAISLASLGDYELVVQAIDGADNKTERMFGTITAVPGGRIMFDELPVVNATVTVYTYNEIIQKFEPWNAEPFKQKNPQATNERGEFQYILPPGTYYLDIKATGLRPTQTEIFSLTEYTALHPTLEMSKQYYLPLGKVALPLPPLFWKKTISANLQSENITVAAQEEVAPQSLPQAPLYAGTEILTPASLVTKPTLLTFITDWSPYTGSQLTQLEDLEKLLCDQIEEPACINVIPILIQGTPTQATLLQERGRYSHTIYADPTGEFSAALNVNTIPTHILIQADHTIAATARGIQTADELRQLISD